MPVQNKQIQQVSVVLTEFYKISCFFRLKYQYNSIKYQWFKQSLQQQQHAWNCSLKIVKVKSKATFEREIDSSIICKCLSLLHLKFNQYCISCFWGWPWMTSQYILSPFLCPPLANKRFDAFNLFILSIYQIFGDSGIRTHGLWFNAYNET